MAMRRLYSSTLILCGLCCCAFGESRAIPMANPGFEEGTNGWEFQGKTGNCTVTDKLAWHGKHSLQILSTATNGVSVRSDPIACKGPMLLELHGHFLARWGYQLRLKLEQLDDDGRVVTNAPSFTLGPFGLNNVWEDLVGYRGVGPVQITEKTTHVRIALEGRPERQPMEVYFDGFQLFDLGKTATNRQPATIAARLLKVTGRRTRIAWTRGDRDAGGILMGLDTDTGRERIIVDTITCVDPCITPDGARVVFTGPEQTGYVVDWSGDNLRPLMQGRHHYIVGVWRDPETDVEWVYAGDNFAPETVAALKASGAASDDSALSIYRYRLDDLSVRELVWDKVPANRRLQVGWDGMSLAGEFPWPRCGVAKLPNVTWSIHGRGCNPGLAPDGSGRFFFLLGNHRQLRVLPPGGPSAGSGTLIYVNTMAGNLKDPHRKVWRPRWSNNVLYFTINSCDVAPSSDIYLGAFNDDFSALTEWVRITESDEYDADGSAWIEPEE